MSAIQAKERNMMVGRKAASSYGVSQILAFLYCKAQFHKAADVTVNRRVT